MTKQLSFTKYENKILANFRQKINKAESTEDVKKFFVQTVKELFIDIFGEEMKFEHEDFRLRFDDAPYFILSDRVLSLENVKSVWNERQGAGRRRPSTLPHAPMVAAAAGLCAHRSRDQGSRRGQRLG